jgi:hypothetical protein
MRNKVIFRVNTSFNGTATYQLYDDIGCGVTGGTATYTGTTQVVNGSSLVEIDDVELTENMSIKVVDSNGCQICQNQTIVIPEQPEPPVEESEIDIEYYIQAFNRDLMIGGDNNATGYLTLNFQTLTGPGSIVTDGVVANREITDTTQIETIRVKSETNVQIIASNVTPTFDDNVITRVEIYAYYPAGNIPPELSLFDEYYDKTVGSPINNTVNLVASDGFGSRVIVKYRIIVTFIGYYNSLVNGPII